MKLIIDIPEEDYKFIKDLQSLIIGGRGNCKTIQKNVINAIRNGTPVTDHSLEIAQKSIELGRSLGITEERVESKRPQGKYVDINKLRLMTVEECAGHTIDYAMGWKACVEWIKKGGAK